MPFRYSQTAFQSPPGVLRRHAVHQTLISIWENNQLPFWLGWIQKSYSRAGNRFTVYRHSQHCGLWYWPSSTSRPNVARNFTYFKKPHGSHHVPFFLRIHARVCKILCTSFSKFCSTNFGKDYQPHSLRTTKADPGPLPQPIGYY